MIALMPQRKLLSRRALPRVACAVALLAAGFALSGCASSAGDMGDNLSLAFVDPARYDFYDCKQLETERKSITNRIQETKRLMDKAETGFAGSVVAEVAYRNDYIANIAQAKLADEVWKRNNCRESAPGAAPAAASVPGRAKGTRGPSRAGNAVY